MKKNGFTLAELLGVITLLALLLLIVLPTIDKTLKEGREGFLESQLKSIEVAAQSWGIDHPGELPEAGTSKTITLSRLQQDGFIANDIKNEKTGEPFDGNLEIKITSHGTYYSYEVITK